MSAHDQGLLVFGTSGTDHVRDAAYDSRLGRLQADLTRTPPHLALIDNLVGGSAFASNPAGSPSTVITRELLVPPIPHGLPFTPEVLCYFFVKSVNGNPADANANGYSASVYFLSGSSGTIEDTVNIEVDSKELRIVHQLQDFGFGVTYTSPAPGYLFRVKYYILSNPAHVDHYSYGDGGIVG